MTPDLKPLDLVGNAPAARFVFDGGAVHVPLQMGTPRADQLQGTPFERLAELAGRVCYESVGVGRDSKEYHRHIIDVGHLSVWEHGNVTVLVSTDRAIYAPTRMPLWECLQRPGVWITSVPEPTNSFRMTVNGRALLEWEQWSEERGLSSEAAGAAAGLQIAKYIGFLIAPALFTEVMPPPGVTVRLVLPETKHEKWVSLWLYCSRGCCYDATTDVLTEDGWKPWPTVTGLERFASMTESGDLVYEHATALHTLDHDGPMYEVVSEQVNLCVTPNHRMWVQLVDTQAAKRGEEPFAIRTAEDLLHRRVRYQKGAARWAGRRPELVEIPPTRRDSVNRHYAGARYPAHAFARFLGWWLAEGHLGAAGTDTGIYLTQNPGPICDEMVSTLESMGLPVTNLEQDGGCRRLCVKHVALYDWLRANAGDGAIRKRVPRMALGWSVDLLRELLDAMIDGDGNRHAANGHEVVYTSSPGLADDIQEIAFKVGLSANIRTVDRVRDEHPGPCGSIINRSVAFVVSILRSSRLYPHVNNNRGSLRQGAPQWEKFERDGNGNCDRMVMYCGEVYCVTVPHGLLYVRRGGKPVWSGNSHEVVRHGDFTGISQRSTRYVDESESPWIEHPLLAAWRAEHPGPFDPVKDGMPPGVDGLHGVEVEEAARDVYDRTVERLQSWLLTRGVDKATARKQARGAARGYLGNALSTQLIFSASIAQWKRMLKQRCSDAADAEIRVLFVEILRLLQASRYGDCFTDVGLVPAKDGIGQVMADTRVFRG